MAMSEYIIPAMHSCLIVVSAMGTHSGYCDCGRCTY